jgi:hypothetical protein
MIELHEAGSCRCNASARAGVSGMR